MSITMRTKKSGKKAYQVKLEGIDGKWISKTFKTLQEARAYDTRLKNKKIDGEVICNKVNKLLVKDYWKQWCETANSKASKGWEKKQKQMYRDYIGPEIGNLKLLTITPAHISKILVKMKNIGRAAQTIMHVYNILHKMFDDSIEMFEYRSRSPVKKNLRPKLHSKETEHLSLEESKRLLRYVRDKEYGLGVWIQLLCGLRACEIIYLKWDEHIDFRLNKLKVRGTWRRSEARFVDYPKGKSWFSRTIPPELITYLKKAKLESTCEYVVTAIKNNQSYASYHTYYKALKRYCKEAGVNCKISTHGLRHSTSEIYMEYGATEEDMQILFDHSSPETTALYIHGKHKKQSEIDKVAGVIQLFPEAVNE